MNVEIRTEAAQFPEKEYMNGIFVAVHVHARQVPANFLPSLLFVSSPINAKFPIGKIVRQKTN